MNSIKAFAPFIVLALTAASLAASPLAAPNVQTEAKIVSSAYLYPEIYVGGGAATLGNPNPFPIFVSYGLTVQNGFGTVFNLFFTTLIPAGSTFTAQPNGTVVLQGAITGWQPA